MSTIVDTQLCFPPEPSNPTGDTIAAGAQWDDLTLAKAVCFSRYASAVHGCLPGAIAQLASEESKARRPLQPLAASPQITPCHDASVAVGPRARPAY
jgi:hypothetical protein